MMNCIQIDYHIVASKPTLRLCETGLVVVGIMDLYDGFKSLIQSEGRQFVSLYHFNV